MAVSDSELNRLTKVSHALSITTSSLQGLSEQTTKMAVSDSELNRLTKVSHTLSLTTSSLQGVSEQTTKMAVSDSELNRLTKVSYTLSLTTSSLQGVSEQTTKMAVSDSELQADSDCVWLCVTVELWATRRGETICCHTTGGGQQASGWQWLCVTVCDCRTVSD